MSRRASLNGSIASTSSNNTRRKGERKQGNRNGAPCVSDSDPSSSSVGDGHDLDGTYLSISNTLLNTFLAEGEKGIKNRHWERAITAFTKALEHEPSSRYAYVCRSKCYTNLGLFDKGIADAEKALEYDPKDHRGYLAKAECLYASGKFEYALVFYYKGYDLRKDVEDFKKGIRKAKIAINESIEQDEIDRNQKLEITTKPIQPPKVALRPSSAKANSSMNSTNSSQRTTLNQSKRVVTPGEVFNGGSSSFNSSIRRPSANTNPTPPKRPMSAGFNRPSTSQSSTCNHVRPSSAKSNTTPSGSNMFGDFKPNTNRPSSARPASTTPRPKSAYQRKEKYLLGEFTKDEQYLNSLLQDKSLRKSITGVIKPDNLQIDSLVKDQLNFLDKRKEFWRHSITTGSTTSAIHVTPTPTPHSSPIFSFRKEFTPHSSSSTHTFTRPQSATAIMYKKKQPWPTNKQYELFV